MIKYGLACLQSVLVLELILSLLNDCVYQTVYGEGVPFIFKLYLDDLFKYMKSLDVCISKGDAKI